MSRLTQGGTVEPVSRDQILRRERGQGNIHVSCSADHVQDWQHYYPADLYYSRYICHMTYQVRVTIDTYSNSTVLDSVENQNFRDIMPRSPRDCYCSKK